MKIFLVSLTVCLSFHIYHCENLPELKFYKTYDVVQLGQRIFEDLQSSNTLRNNSEFLEDIHTAGPFEFDPKLLKDIFTNASSRCLHDLEYFVDNLNTTDFRKILSSWAFQMVDAYGKPESGIVLGNFKWLGDFDECKKVYVPKENSSDEGGFYGKYCGLQIPIGSQLVALSMGLCVPDSCGGFDLKNGIMEFIHTIKILPYKKKIETVMNSTAITCHANSRELTNGAIATITILSFFTLLAILGSFVTAYKYLSTSRKRKSFLHESSIRINYDKENEDDSDEILLFTEGAKTKFSVFLEKADSFLNCFCVFTNGAKLLNTDATEGQMMCLHGIRFLSMSWVILAHTYAFSFGSVRAMKVVLDRIDNFPFEVILNGFFSVDSFFVLSAFLMSYLYLQEAAKKKGNLSWAYFYIHRYLRLTPVYMLVIAFYTTIYPYLGSGPFWPDYDVEPLCQKNWWWNLLYINNFQKTTEGCLGWSWYLANDMQFFVISPLFLITLWRWPTIGYSLLTTALFGSWAASFIITYDYNLFSGFGDIATSIIQPDFMDRWTVYFEKLYIKPYSRIGPYLVGIALGYILFKRKITPTRDSKIILFVGWVVATSVGLTCVYSLYHNTTALVATSFYNALSRTAFGLCLSWVIYVCLTQQAVVVDKILSFKLFVPLSRLTYSAYLIHPMLIIGYFGSMRTTLDFSHQTMVILFLGLLTVTYAFSLIVSLLFESPIIRLEKLIRSKFHS
ncbi:nose resistant to fluoxetine protein 6 [Parasteatoda tepidariorum]|uniref:nose resistant to fluoxetine protein 6 n=1 Tax=Parasteatoda tepidariorum TaxID=114398 RepID=UPI001C72656E|nr:nose resistant to fluoxetine protein 6 [Parasteatoda tepidariorum]